MLKLQNNLVGPGRTHVTLSWGILQMGPGSAYAPHECVTFTGASPRLAQQGAEAPDIHKQGCPFQSQNPTTRAFTQLPMRCLTPQLSSDASGQVTSAISLRSKIGTLHSCHFRTSFALETEVSCALAHLLEKGKQQESLSDTPLCQWGDPSAEDRFRP